MKPIGPGDICVVVCSYDTENLGKLVLVLGVHGPGEPSALPPPRAYGSWTRASVFRADCESLGSPLVVVGKRSGFRRLTPVAPIPVKCLRRLDDGEDADVLVKDKTKEEA